MARILAAADEGVIRSSIARAQAGRSPHRERNRRGALRGELVVSVLPPSVSDSGAIKARRNARYWGARQNLEIPQQPLDVVELELRAERLAEAAA